MKIYWDGESKNVIGAKVLSLRKERGWTQKKLSELLQLEGFEFSELSILRIEKGLRFVPDYEIKALAKVFDVSYETLLDE